MGWKMVKRRIKRSLSLSVHVLLHRNMPARWPQLEAFFINANRPVNSRFFACKCFSKSYSQLLPRSFSVFFIIIPAFYLIYKPARSGVKAENVSRQRVRQTVYALLYHAYMLHNFFQGALYTQRDVKWLDRVTSIISPRIILRFTSFTRLEIGRRASSQVPRP